MPVAPDNFANRGGAGYGTPYHGGAAVTPSDIVDNELPQVTLALYVGGTGTLRVKMVDGTQLDFAGVVGLQYLRVRQVLATGTSATGIVALW